MPQSPGEPRGASPSEGHVIPDVEMGEGGEVREAERLHVLDAIAADVDGIEVVEALEHVGSDPATKDSLNSDTVDEGEPAGRLFAAIGGPCALSGIDHRFPTKRRSFVPPRGAEGARTA